jgi:tetratricopeptide (TPR) repeat protein
MAENGIDLDKAERMSAICVRQQPDNDTALDTYAWIFFKKKDYARAKEMIDRAVAIESEDPQADVLHHAGDIYYMNGEPESAIEFWEEALKLDPDNKLLQKKVKNRTHYYE